MKKAFLIFTILALFSCTKEADNAKRIPESASAVILLNMPSIANKVVMDKLTSLGFLSELDLFGKELIDTSGGQLQQMLSAPAKFGIDIKSKIYGCRISNDDRDYWIVIFHLSNKKDLENSLSEKFSSETKEKNGFSYFSLDSKYLLGWQEDAAVIVFPEIPESVENQADVLSLLNSEKDKVLPQEIQKTINSTSDISLWMNRVPSQTTLPDAVVASEVFFEDGTIRCLSEIRVPGYEDYLQLLTKDNSDKAFSGELPFSGAFYLNLSKFRTLDSSMPNKVGFSPEILANAFSGRGAILVSGTKLTSKEYISMELDENYELVEKKRTSTDTIPSWALALDVTERMAVELGLAALHSQGLIQKEGDGYSTVYPTDGHILFKDNFLLVTNNPDSCDVNSLKQLLRTGSPLTINANIPLLASAFAGYASTREIEQGIGGKEKIAAIKNISFRVDELQKEKLTSSLIIELSNKEQNALTQLATLFKKEKSQSTEQIQ